MPARVQMRQARVQETQTIIAGKGAGEVSKSADNPSNELASDTSSISTWT